MYSVSLIANLSTFIRLLSIVILSCLQDILSAQKLTTDNPDFFYQISPVFDFKESIVSLTFDDGYTSQFSIGIPILKERNIPATFYIITDYVDSITKNLISGSISKEFEVGSHTFSHPDLVKIGNAEAKDELLKSKSFLYDTFGANAGLTMSYPWGIYNNSIKSIAENIYMAARTTDPGYNSYILFDKYALKTQNFDSQTSVSTTNSWIDFAIRNKLWLIEMIHGIDNSGFSPIKSDALIGHSDYINEVRDKIWCSTVSNVIKYIEESEKATIGCDLCNDTVYKIRINDFLDDSVYDHPLSVRIKVPGNWDSIRISDAGKINTIYNNKNKFILFNVLPDNHLVVIRPGYISVPEKETGLRLVYLGPDPFSDDFRLSIDALEQIDIHVALCNLYGKLLVQKKEKNVNGVINFFFDTSGIGSGIYILRVSSSDGNNIIKKLIKI
jgi:peptidoglycan/xylan/chitin deacetylase (PgdA/CDA1 family)